MISHLQSPSGALDAEFITVGALTVFGPTLPLRKRRPMKTAIILAFLASGICWAQPPADCKPSSLNIPGAPYPCVFPDRRAMFRVAAPNAQKVKVRVGTGFDMTKEADGLWYATTTPLVEGFHYYMLTIDDATFSDPATADILWRRRLEQRHRDSRCRRRFLQPQRRSPRRGARSSGTSPR